MDGNKRRRFGHLPCPDQQSLHRRKMDPQRRLVDSHGLASIPMVLLQSHRLPSVAMVLLQPSSSSFRHHHTRLWGKSWLSGALRDGDLPVRPGNSCSIAYRVTGDGFTWADSRR
jgi:hypothetical protein